MAQRRTAGGGLLVGKNVDNRPGLMDVTVLAIMATLVYLYVRNHYTEVKLVRSKVDDRTYLVRNLPDHQAAADLLATLSHELCRVIRHAKAKYPKKKSIQRLYENFDPENVSEGGTESGYTSYSVNKGEKLVMCVRHKDDGFVDTNVLLYVAIHELAHLMTKGMGHTDTFWDNFKFLLREAIAIGVYKKVDYARHPQKYCGITISSSVV